MKLHSLGLRDFRGVADRTVDLPESGTTVIVGDNEVGKSSLIEALVLLFDLPDDSGALRVRAVQPVGRDVGPEVFADVTLGESRLEYRKRWLRSKATELVVTTAGGRTPYTGREAHDEASRLFAEHVDPVLWQTLMVGQGNALVLPAPADAEPLIAAVETESGKPLDGASMPLVAAVEQEYRRYWTKGGRPTGDFARAGAALAKAEAGVDAAGEQMAAVEADVRQAERLTDELADLRKRLDDHAAQVAALEVEARQAETLLVRRDAAAGKADLMRVRLENRTRIRTERDRLLADLERWASEVADLTALRNEADDRVKETLAEVHRAQALLTAATEEREGCQDAVEHAAAVLTRIADKAELVRLTARQAELESVRSRIASARAVVDGIAVDGKLVAALEAAHAASVEARAALAAGAPQITVRRVGEAAVSLSDGTELASGETIDRIVDGEFRVAVPGQLEMSVRAGGEVAALRAAVDEAARHEEDLLTRSGATDLAEARDLFRQRDTAMAELAEARRTEQTLTAGGDPASQIATLTTRLTTAEPTSLRPGATTPATTGPAPVRPRANTSATTGPAAAGSRVDASDTGGPAAVRSRVDASAAAERIDASVAGREDAQLGRKAGGRGGRRADDRAGDELYVGLFEGLGDDGAAEPAVREVADSLAWAIDAEGNDLTAAQDVLDRARSAVAAVERVLADAEFATAQARKAADEARDVAQQVATRYELAADRLSVVTDALAAARGIASDEQVLVDEDAATAEVEAVLVELTAIQAEVDESGADHLAGRLADARDLSNRLTDDHDQLRDNLRLAEGRLEQSGRDGIATRLDAAEFELERVRSEHDRLCRRADAARRVQETLSRHRAAAQSRYAAPLRGRIEELGRSVYGPSFQVALDDDLTVAERELNGVRLGVDALSTGAREQLAIITRLAIADLVSKGPGSVPAIIDDALGWSDKTRLREMGTLLGRAGERGQVIVLTCLPERYQDIPNATTIHLVP